ncbi:hypothetical protein [Brevibacterium marinum]|uniref:Putative membrane protein n=1 Tax=Brevibacterium marinum TaxID=418643 RepID=A0A846S2U9_9MICO|nr:hypothetical protein [Brevibacterium marinum]NJC56471.1 putative membrane protein [Brevibacterium marinum]
MKQETMTSRPRGGAAVKGSLLAAALVMTTTTSPFVGEAEARSADGTGGGKCSVKELPVPNGATTSWVRAGSYDGKHLVGYATVDGEELPGIWHDGEFEQIEVDLRSVSVAAVNNDGSVAGFGFEHGESNRTSFIYEDGEMTELGEPAGADATVTDLNDHGDAVGYAVETGSSAPGLRWSAETPQTAEELPPAGGDGSARAIGNDGTVVGNVGVPDEGTDAYVWHPDDSHGKLPKIDDRPLSAAEDVSGPYAVGFSDVDIDNGSQVLWNLEEKTVEELPANLKSAQAVTSSGHVAARTNEGKVALVRDGDVTVLPTLGGDSATAYTLSEQDVAAGQSDDEAGTGHAVVWTGC